MANSSFDHFTSAGKSGLDIFHSLAGVALSQFEQLAAHQIAAARTALHEQTADSKRLLDSKEPQAALHLQAARAQPLIDRGIAYYRGLYDISAAAHDAFAKLLEQHHDEVNKTVTALLDRYAGASANSGLAVEAVKSALSAANSAFENANKAARQVADITEASISAAGKATARAGESAAPSRRKAA